VTAPVSVIVVGSSPWSAELADDDLNVRTALGLAQRLGGRYDVIVSIGTAGAGEAERGPIRLFRVAARTRAGFVMAARRAVDRVAGVRAHGPRVILSSDPLAALIVESSRSRRRLPHIFQVQGEILTPGREYGGWLKRRAIAAATNVAVRRSSGIRVVSESLRSAIEPMTDRRVTVIGSRVDTQVFAPAATRVELPVDAIMVGSLVKVKNHEAVIRAWALVVRERPRAQLMLVGDGHCRRQLAALVDALGLRANVRFRGVVAHREIADLLTSAKCLIHSSWSEGQPRAVLEAMACGLPVICSDIPAHREIVPAAVGLLIPPGDVGGWAAALAGVLDDPVGAGEMGRRGRALVMEHHDLVTNLDRYADFIRTVAATRWSRVLRP
jgi:glycosyltransferase involved in cell wall biosynthesis